MMNNVLLTPKQDLFLSQRQPIKALCGGRGSGKSFTIGQSILDKMIEMPRSLGALIGPTYEQIKSKTFKSVEESFEAAGFIRDIHYTVGIEPPKHFKRPHTKIVSWKNIVCFYWGSAFEFGSTRNARGIRGASYDWIEIDEAGLIKAKDYKEVILPTLRGNKSLFSSDLHYQVCLYSSIPQTAEGAWFLEIEDKHNSNPEQYYFLEMNAYDNLIAWTEEKLELLKEEMGYLKFQIEVMNMRNTDIEDAFYDMFDIEKHTYLNHNDYDTERDLEVCFDFGGWINCATIWQQYGKEERCINNMYKKGKNTLLELILEICQTYKHHPKKKIKAYGEPRGHDPLPASETLYEIVKRAFQSQGWQCEIMTPKGNKTMGQAARNEQLNELFSETRPDLPIFRFNSLKAKTTINAIRNTRKNADGTKDKTLEKKRDFPQEKATHLTDTVDYFFVQKYLLKRLYVNRSREASLR